MVKFAAMKFAFISFLRGIYTNLNFSARHLISNYFGLRKDIYLSCYCIRWYWLVRINDVIFDPLKESICFWKKGGSGRNWCDYWNDCTTRASSNFHKINKSRGVWKDRMTTFQVRRSILTPTDELVKIIAKNQDLEILGFPLHQ